ncbi:hypothetical protein [Paractinoplanes globisporus]|uniref:Molecular chaperone DnaJ n=1 Tax=Paractinoplanes globisporus TaxID=113565 RepID=A0ABW6WCP3_9ACTN|nr:hypothetical protein [Actinoplanes globisporus]
MCNPRRIRARATRRIAEAWEHETRRQVTLRGEVSGEARVREALDGSLGAPTLAALFAVLSRNPDWTETDGVFRRDVDGGYLLYHTATREIEIVAVSRAAVVGHGDAAATVRAELDQTVESEGVGIYYDDQATPFHIAHARRMARHNAEGALDAAAGRARAARRREIDAEQEAGLSEEAARRAREDLQRQSADRAESVQRIAAEQLAAVGVQARGLFHQALAEAYRDAILAFARSRGATGVRSVEHDGVIDIEFEYDA